MYANRDSGGVPDIALYNALFGLRKDLKTRNPAGLLEFRQDVLRRQAAEA
jgi:hypothetical protein